MSVRVECSCSCSSVTVSSAVFTVIRCCFVPVIVVKFDVADYEEDSVII